MLRYLKLPFCLFLPQGYEVLSKYVALYAANLIKDTNTLKALDLFCRYGAPANPQVSLTRFLVDRRHFIYNNRSYTPCEVTKTNIGIQRDWPGIRVLALRVQYSSRGAKDWRNALDGK